MSINTNKETSMQLAFAHRSVLGECLLWHADTGRWWWTDIESACLYAWAPGSAGAIRFNAPDRVGSFAFCQSGRLLLGLSKQLCLADVPDISDNATRHLQVSFLADVDAAEIRTRINDGRTDRRGYFVFGTMNEGGDNRPIGSFYQFSLQHGLRRLALPAVSIANSICFSPDGTTLYFTDSLTKRIMLCDYDSESARVGNVRLFAEVTQAEASPDGSVIDRHGCLWNAQWGAGQIVQYSPTGRPLHTISVAAKNPTCPAFGGAESDLLMVTSSRMEMSGPELKQMPLAGSLFALQVPADVTLADTLFDDRNG